MTRALNGLHWQSPVDLNSLGSRAQVNACTVGFGSVLILSHSWWNPGGAQDYSNSEANIYWLERNRACNAGGASFNEVVITRLYYPQQGLPGFPSDPGQLAAQWGPFIQWCQGQGVYNFVVLNEPDLEYNGQLWPVTADSQSYMTGLAQALRSQGLPGYPVYLGFPGPSGNIPPGGQYWAPYWTGYRDVILNNYNNLAPHIYGQSDTGLENAAAAAYADLTGWFPNFPIRYTEYGIPLNSPNLGGAPGNRVVRAQMYGNFVNWVRANQPWVYACHAFVARNTPDFDTSPNYYTLYDNETQILAERVGCVGQ